MSTLYSAAPQPPQLEAVPTDKDFVTALETLGLVATGPDQDVSKQTGAQDLPDDQAVLKGTMFHLQLVLRALAAVCRYQKQVGLP